MHRLNRMLPALALALATAVLFAAAPACAEGDPEARKAKILANLKLQFPQLEQMSVTMGEITASGFAGLDEGSFTLTAQGGQQVQKFLVSADDTKLYLVGLGPVDVSRSMEEIQAALKEREEAERQEIAAVRQQLSEAIAGRPVRGNPEARVTIVEFSDFQCPYCARGAQTIEQILEKYGTDVRFVFKHFPLDFHPWAKPASIAAHCAGQQNHGAFWTLHDRYFEHQKEITPDNVLAKSKEYLAGSGIDMAAWSTCAEDQGSDAYKAAAAQVDGDMAFGQQLGVSGTPGFFVNGRFVNGAQPMAAFEPLIAEAKNDS